MATGPLSAWPPHEARMADRHAARPALLPWSDSQARLAALASGIVEYAPQAMMALDASSLRIVLANRAAHQLFPGVDDDQLIADTFPWMAERGLLAQLTIVAGTGEPMRGLELECEGLPPFTDAAYLRYDIVPLGEPGEVPLAILLVVSDATEEWLERQRVEQSAFNAQLYAERIEAVIEQLSEAVVIRDADGTLVTYNRAALALARNRRSVERARARGARLEPRWVWLQPDGTPAPEVELPSFRAMLAAAPVSGFQFLVRKQNGREIPVLAHAAPLRDELGTITGSVVAFQDITAVKEVERLKDEFISVASHELRQPLTVIQGNAQMLKRHLKRVEHGVPLTAETLHSIAEGVETQTARLNLLVSDLLDMSRIQAGQLRLEQTPAPLVETVRRVVEAQRKAAGDHQVTLEAETIPTIAEIVGNWDVRRVEQILMNLLSNAVKYSPRGGAVRVRVNVLPHGHVREQLHGRPRRVPGPAALIAITDEGIGIPEEALRRLFERFFRARNTAGIQGTGLGLFISRQLAWAHQGDLWAESPGAGRGSTFYLVLPLLG